MFGPVHLWPAQHGAPVAPHIVHTPALVVYVSQTAAGSRHLVVGEVLFEPQQVLPVSPQA